MIPINSFIKNKNIYIDITNAIYVCDGNSLTLGSGNPYTSQIAALNPFLANSSVFNNLGVSGQQTSQMITDFATQVIPYYNSSYPCFYLVNEIGNDLHNNGSVISAIDRFYQLCAKAKSAGFIVGIIGLQDRIYTGTLTPGGDTPEQYYSKMQQCRNLLDASWYDWGDIYINLYSDIRLKDANNTAFFTDKTHNTSDGYGIWASMIRDAIVKYTKN